MSEQPDSQQAPPDDETQPMRTRRAEAQSPQDATPPRSAPLPRTPSGGVIPARHAPREPRRMPPPPPPEMPYSEPPRYVVPTAELAEPAPAARSPRDSGLYFPWWSVVGMVAVAGLISCGLWGLVFSMGGTAPPGGRTPTIVITTATPAPAALATVPPTAAPTETESPPTLEPTATLPPSDIEIGIGVQVEIVGTGPQGLNMREGASTVYESVDVAKEGEVFLVQDGPQFGSGYEWWYIVDPKNPDRAGWSVRQFMQVIAPASEE